MKGAIFMILGVVIINGLTTIIKSDEVKYLVKQSNKHHDRFHNLIVDSIQTHDRLERVLYDIGCSPTSVTVECGLNQLKQEI
jgi:hypothetical protein